MIRFIQRFIEQEFFAGCLLVFSAIMALIMVNSPFTSVYFTLLSLPLGFQVSHYSLVHPLIFWLNEGFMTLFFLLVGMEIKREILIGELKQFNKAILPIIAAIGGMCVPSLFFAFINWHDVINLQGWAIPSATDIAFALAVLSLFSKRIPFALKIFLMALAIMDDLGAILIIGFFYSHDLSWLSLLWAASCVLLLVGLNRTNVKIFTPYAVIGGLLWVCVLNSGIHPTLAGVIIALTYPLERGKEESGNASLDVEAALLPWVNYLILPLFAFFNAGLSLTGIGWDIMRNRISLGIIIGLLVGKQLGVFLSCWLALKMKWAKLPAHVHLGHIYGVSILCGIGFTMSLFIGGLAFQGLSATYMDSVRAGVLLGSLLSALLGGLFILAYSRYRTRS